MFALVPDVVGGIDVHAVDGVEYVDYVDGVGYVDRM